MVWPFRRRRAKGDTVDSGPVTTENWDQQDCKISVTQREGFLCKVQLRAKIDCPPDQVFDTLVDPDNARYFSTVKAVTFRKVLKDAGLDGERKVEVEQAAGWRFLFFSGLFFTRLFVFENKRKGTIRFKLAEQGVMKDFEGLWKIQPFTQTSVNEAMGQGTRFSRFSGKLFSGVAGVVGNKPQASLITLEQSVAPSMAPPKAMNGYMTKITANIIATIVDDLKGEVQRIQEGKPIPKSQLKKLEKAQKLKKDELPEIVRAVASLALAQAARMPRPDRFASLTFKPWSGWNGDVPLIEEIE